ncbi:hypothetical protein SynBMKMC1_00339 [Synechococcus sp. BMK-MC-1]|nr:hypothetical protein SynBMKMC1_00339 [Synechococcus sp. BMK-MC-1]
MASAPTSWMASLAWCSRPPAGHAPVGGACLCVPRRLHLFQRLHHARWPSLCIIKACW